ncbi:MAG TPA: RNA polymerase sigma factor [Candidatus Anaerobutyricum stercoris]|uniref:RNA polymerase sigma factor n=1 Tax=Candidatus Anaerobutyricum stercoris TaxID=2838457 RepID=A0A9D2EK25_9FIRM|nr:RNA polymerase sigma factor [Candidatus Anaerobutyricum stercoris]
MEDKDIIALYWERSERAIEETDIKYGKLCRSISMGIVDDRRDSEEVINDSWLAVWNTLPPQWPKLFKAYVCRIVKNLSLKRFTHNHALKRKCVYEQSLEELNDCAGHGAAIDDAVMKEELVKTVSRFLGDLSDNNRDIFLERYWFASSLEEIAERHDISKKTTSMRLSRIREQLKKYLRKEGYDL